MRKGIRYMDTQKRNSGIDILRVLSMFGIIGLHIINQGGIISNIKTDNPKYYIVLFVLVILFASVNVFGIMTGYLNVNKKQNKNSRIIELFAITVFWSFVITGVFYALNLYNIRTNGFKELLGSLFPFAIGRYWYITCYVLLFFMIPYINILIKRLTKKQFKTMLILLFILFTIIPNIVHYDLFGLKSGYSPFWLMYCYFIGAYIRLYKDDRKTKKWGLIVSLALAYIINILIKIILKKPTNDTWFIDYISPFIIWFAAELFILFKRINIKSKTIATVVKYISISSFSVYIIHCHKLIFDYINKDLFVFLNNYNALVIVGVIILSIIGVYLACMILDQSRIIIFKIFRINKLIDYIGLKLDKILDLEESNQND